MPFPNIHSCVISEDLRPELSGQATIIGFYGVAPNVDIVLKDLSLPLQKLTVSLLADRGSGRFNFSLKVVDEDRRPLVPVFNQEVNLAEVKKKYAWTFQFVNVKFNRAGRYFLTVEFDNKIVFDTSFEVRQGTPEDFS